jgi:hypothetical protein
LDANCTGNSLVTVTKIDSEFLKGRQSFGVLLTDGKNMFKVLPKNTVSESGMDSNEPGQSLVLASYEHGHKMQIIS